MKKEELTFYRDLLGEIKTRVRAGQQRAALASGLPSIETIENELTNDFRKEERE